MFSCRERTAMSVGLIDHPRVTLNNQRSPVSAPCPRQQEPEIKPRHRADVAPAPTETSLRQCHDRPASGHGRSESGEAPVRGHPLRATAVAMLTWRWWPSEPELTMPMVPWSMVTRQRRLQTPSIKWMAMPSLRQSNQNCQRTGAITMILTPFHACDLSDQWELSIQSRDILSTNQKPVITTLMTSQCLQSERKLCWQELLEEQSKTSD